jgi:DNA-directed RNA polymerase specialized sigma24 family protein
MSDQFRSSFIEWAYPILLRAAFFTWKEEQRSKDSAQNAVVKLLTYIDKNGWPENKNLPAWVFQVGRNAALQDARKTRTDLVGKAMPLFSGDSPRDIPGPPSESDDRELWATWREQCKKNWQTLTLMERRVFVLRLNRNPDQTVAAWTHDAADILKIRPNSVITHQKAAFRKLGIWRN